MIHASSQPVRLSTTATLLMCVLFHCSCADEKKEASDSPYKIQRDVIFDQKHQLGADIYQPSDQESPVPLVMIVHGGAWMSGDKWMPSAYAHLLAKKGIAAVSINYRLAPKHQFPAQIDDMRSALRWIQSSAKQRQWDLQRFGLFGYSAGAHLCCMIGTLYDEPDEHVVHTSELPADKASFKKLPRPVAIVAGGTPTDFREIPPDSTILKYFFGGTRSEKPEAYRFASPAAMASKDDVPTMFFHGTSDAIVPIAGSKGLFKKHRELNISSEYVEVEGFGHFLSFLHDTSLESTDRFFRKRLLNEPLAPPESAPENPVNANGKQRNDP